MKRKEIIEVIKVSNIPVEKKAEIIYNLTMAELLEDEEEADM